MPHILKRQRHTLIPPLPLPSAPFSPGRPVCPSEKLLNKPSTGFKGITSFSNCTFSESKRITAEQTHSSSHRQHSSPPQRPSLRTYDPFSFVIYNSLSTYFFPSFINPRIFPMPPVSHPHPPQAVATLVAYGLRGSRGACGPKVIKQANGLQ